MERFITLSIAQSSNSDVANAVRLLLSSKGGYSEHKQAILALLPLCGFCGGITDDTVSTEARDSVLADIRHKIEAHVGSVQHSMKNVISAHLIVVDAAVEGEVADVQRPLHARAIERIGGKQLAQLVDDYTVIRDMCAEPPAVAIDVGLEIGACGLGSDELCDLVGSDACPIPSDDTYKDLRPAAFVEVHDKPTGSYVLRQVGARNNDTAQSLAKHFRCTVDRLVELNPKDAESGFGKRSVRLRKNAPVADYRTPTDGLTFF